VSDLTASEACYTQVFGVEPVLDEDASPFRHIIYPVGDTAFGLHGFPDLASKEPFNERKPGLDHIAFDCTSRDDIADASYGSGLSFRDPDNNALELFAPPA